MGGSYILISIWLLLIINEIYCWLFNKNLLNIKIYFKHITTPVGGGSNNVLLDDDVVVCNDNISVDNDPLIDDAKTSDVAANDDPVGDNIVANVLSKIEAQSVQQWNVLGMTETACPTVKCLWNDRNSLYNSEMP